MQLANTSAAYAAPLRALHWLMLALIAATCIAMEFKSIFPKGSAGRESMMLWHYTLGLWVFCLVLPRLLLRLPGTAPAIVPTPPAWQASIARAVHVALYALMIILPLLGWLALSAKGTPLSFLGVDLPMPLEPNRVLAKRLKDVHEALATAGYFIVGLHAAAALYHHLLLRDNTLRLMWPQRRR